MKEIEGDIVSLIKTGNYDTVVHGCNCFHTMGNGVALSLRNAFPEVQQADLRTPFGHPNKLGTYSKAIITINDTIHVTIVNAYTQYHYGRKHLNFNYDTLREVFKSIKDEFTGNSIIYPMIGAGNGKGNWDIISSIIDNELMDEDHTVIIYKK